MPAVVVIKQNDNIQRKRYLLDVSMVAGAREEYLSASNDTINTRI